VVAQQGVVKAAVNFANTSLLVEYIPTITSPEKLKQAVQSIGYDLMIEDSKEAKEALEDLHKQKLQSLKQKTIWSVILSIPLVTIGMFFMNIPYANFIMWALATPVVLVFAKQFFINAFKQAKHHSANMDTLVALSTGIAYVFSVFNTVYPQFRQNRGLHAHVYFEAAAVVIAFILLGKLLEEKAKASTSSAIKKLIGLQPNTVTIIHHDGHIMEIPIEQVKVGDLLLVKPGEKIPVDGIVENGESFIYESMISGEPIPVLKEKGTKVLQELLTKKEAFNSRQKK
jgi:Cu2+-exporting ATPase